MLLCVFTLLDNTKMARKVPVNIIMRNGNQNSCSLYRQDISKYFIKIFFGPSRVSLRAGKSRRVKDAPPRCARYVFMSLRATGTPLHRVRMKEK
jgi:hypothetical protein